MTQIFLLITFALKALGYWEDFLDHVEVQRRVDAEKMRQARSLALNDAAKAKTPEEAFAAQKRIVDGGDKP